MDLNKIKEIASKFSSAKGLVKWTKDNDCYNILAEKLKEVPEFESVENVAYSIIKDKPIKVCPVCGKYISYRKIKKGKDKFCSDACYRSPAGLELAKQKRIETNIKVYGSYEAAVKAHHDKWLESVGGDITKAKLFSNETRQKARQTMIERYGAATTLGSELLKAKVENTMEKLYGHKKVGHCKEIRDKIDKTNIERYGHRCVFGGAAIKEKIKQVNIERYGTEYAAASDIVQERIKSANKEKYGVNFPLENKEICQKALEAGKSLKAKQVLERISESGFDILDDYKQVTGYNYNIKCRKCGTIINRNLATAFSFRCPKCQPYTYSDCEKAVFDLLDSWGISYVPHVRNILSGSKELDIVVEDKKVAIEVDGIYWHTEAGGKDKNYHLNKTIECEKAGYRLIHIFSDEIKYKFCIVKNRLANILGMTTIRVQARKCTVREISQELADKFVAKYHIQGASVSKVRLGLFYKNRIVAVMTFGKPRYTAKYNWELVRYCTLGSTSVVGGAGKLLSYFKKNYTGSIISYADRRWSQGNIYEKIGFKYSHDSAPAFYYVKGEKRENRIVYQKHKLKDLLENYDDTISADQNMIKNGYNKIWDCGNKVYTYD